jgi:hypothetical protein
VNDEKTPPAPTSFEYLVYVVDDDAVLSWFKGKSQINARAALLALRVSAAGGYWLKGASRRCRAALNKCNVAHKVAHVADEIQKNEPYHIKGRDNPLNNAWYIVHMAMQYGDRYVERIGDAVKILKKAKLTEVQRPVMEKAEKFGHDMAPAIKLMNVLDECRPKPLIAFGTLSRTVVENLFDSRLKLDPKTLRSPEIEWKRVRETLPDGRTVMVWVGIIKWPEGTRHGASKFGTSRAGNDQCEACGHAIKDLSNWVPALIDDEEGVPHSLWVGRDCARKLFGAKVEGEARYEEVR